MWGLILEEFPGLVFWVKDMAFQPVEVLAVGWGSLALVP